VSASRAGTTVLRDVRLDIRAGVTALLGPSGSGKSTLLRLLNRLADPDRGVVRFRGEDVTTFDVRELRRSACLVPQLPAPLPGTVADNVRYGPALFGRAVGVERPLQLAGLTKLYADRDASQLSVGEQQRVMLARALALEPDVLLLDEPTSSLDDYTKGGVERTLAELARETGLSMVLVTHDAPQAERMADRIVRLRDGRVGG
jgi:putative ABC transport system ATP-binding protein